MLACRLGWSPSKSRPAEGHEKPARALRTDRAVDDLAGGWRLKLDAFVAALVAVRMILIRHCLLRQFGRPSGRVRGRAKDGRGTGSARRTLQQRAPGK